MTLTLYVCPLQLSMNNLEALWNVTNKRLSFFIQEFDQSQSYGMYMKIDTVAAHCFDIDWMKNCMINMKNVWLWKLE